MSNMRKLLAIVLAAVMMLAFVPAASAAAGDLKLEEAGAWINLPSGADISVATDSDGNYTIKIAVPFTKITTHSYGTYPQNYKEKAFYFPIISENDSSGIVMVDGIGAPQYGTKNVIKFFPKSGGNSESFAVQALGSGSMYVSVEYIDALSIDAPDYSYYYPGYGYYPENQSVYCNGCLKVVPVESAYYYNGYHYLVCANGHKTAVPYGSSNPYYSSSLQIVGVDEYGDQYKNVSATISGGKINLTISPDAIYGKDDVVRIRVKPVDAYGRAYPSGTVISATSELSGILIGSSTALTSSGAYAYILDKDGSFCINISGIKKLAATNSGTVGTISLSVGTSAWIDNIINYVVKGNADVPSNVSGVIEVAAGKSVSLSYKIGDTVAPASEVTWSVYSKGTGEISISGNTITGISEGAVYVQAKYGASSTIVQINVKGATGAVITDGDAYSVTATALNVRSGPGTGYSILGTLKKGDFVIGQGKTGNWMKIAFNGQTGYVSVKYLTK